MKSEVKSGQGWKCMSSLGAVTNGAARVVEDGNEKHSPKLLTLVIVQKDERVLLGMKKRGFGAGYFSGFGGKVEAKETTDEAAERELQEESGIEFSMESGIELSHRTLSMEKRGILTFHLDDNPQPWEAHVYRVGDYAGAPRGTEEMAPRWFSLTDMPYEKMWQDNPIWYPEFLRGRLFKGDFTFLTRIHWSPILYTSYRSWMHDRMNGCFILKRYSCTLENQRLQQQEHLESSDKMCIASFRAIVPGTGGCF